MNGCGMSEVEFQEYYGGAGSTFQGLAPYMEYQVLDEKGKVLEDSSTMSTEDAAAWDSLTWEEYEFGIGFSFDEDGSPKFQKCVGADVQLIEEEFRIILSDLFYAENTEELDLSGIEAPENRTFYFGMTKDDLDRYSADDIYAHSTISDQVVYTVIIMIAIVMLAALILPDFKSLTTGNEKIFRAPAKLVIFLTCFEMGMLFNRLGDIFFNAYGNAYAGDFILWMCVFAFSYWIGGCVRQIKVMGVRRYGAERVVLYNYYLCEPAER